MTTSVRDVSVRYGRRTVLSDAMLALEGGTFTAIVGPNGSGKSSLLRVLAGVQRPSAGHATTAHGTALIVSSTNPPADVTPRALADYGLALRRPWWRIAPSARDLAAAESALSQTGLLDRADDAVVTLSDGEVQRAWIAAALATNARTLLIDEPTSHLDVRYQLEVLQTLRRLANSGAAIGAAIHDLTLAARFADVVALLAGGRLMVGSPETIFDAARLRDAFGVDVSVHRHPSDGYLVCLPA